MSGITVYSKDNCPYCDKAMCLLEEINAPYKTVKLDPASPLYEQERDALISRTKTNHKTFPFIFVGDAFIGGYQELMKSIQSTNFHALAAKVGIKIEEEF